jgi:stearoyl-CoA desaturase (delta-9 desaturase)
MGQVSLQLGAIDSPHRENFSVGRTIFFVLIHLGALAAFWQTTWGAIAVCVGLHVLCGGFGICVGYHRLLTHRSFKTAKVVEYMMAICGALSMQGGPVEWVALHRKHHQHSDTPGDPHSAAEGFWWSHMLWVLNVPKRQEMKAIALRYAPDLHKQRFYRWLEPINYIVAIVVAVGLYLAGGWPWVVWGMCIRLVATYHITWFVNSASHLWGYKNFLSNDLATNNWWVALVSYGEGWHNNHHAFPTSARHGMKKWEIDFSYMILRTMKAIGLAWDLYVPSPEQMAAKVLPKNPMQQTEDVA